MRFLGATLCLIAFLLAACGPSDAEVQRLVDERAYTNAHPYAYISPDSNTYSGPK